MATTFKKKSFGSHKALGWQQYVREEFSNTPAVSSLMQFCNARLIGI